MVEPLNPRPFLKWVGGKRQLLPYLLRRFRSWRDVGGYHEPFLGGGALFFELHRRGMLPARVLLSDSNPHLVEAYVAVRDHPDDLVDLLSGHAAKHGAAHYRAVRSVVPDEALHRAARLIYLNKTCFNGLYRENASGQFNVPMGSYARPRICDEPNLRACSAALADVRLDCRGFETVSRRARRGDLVYFDPPYVPVSATSSFTTYAKGGFGDDEQVRLARLFTRLAGRGVHVLLSNSMTPRVAELYGDFQIQVVMAGRSVNSRPERRGKIREALVRSAAP